MTSLEKSPFELLNHHHWEVQHGGWSYAHQVHPSLGPDQAGEMAWFHALIPMDSEAVVVPAAASGKPVVCSLWWWNSGLDQHDDLTQYVWAGLYRQLVSATDTL